MSNSVSPHPLFDPDWYQRHNPDLAQDDVCIEHYLATGWREMRSPHPLFSVRSYLDQRPDVAQSGKEPLAHFITEGWKQGASPHPLFDLDFYVAQVDGLDGLDPLTHYLVSGWKSGLRPCKGFDPVWYARKYLARCAIPPEPLSHYIAVGFPAGLQAAPGLEHKTSADADAMLAQIVDNDIPLDLLLTVADAGIAHARYVSLLRADKLLDSYYYLDRSPDVVATGIDPCRHYAERGWREGRNPNPLFHVDWYRRTYGDSIPEDMDPLLHYLVEGVKRGYNPSMLFDTAAYVSRNPDVDFTKINPLAHYLKIGVMRWAAPSVTTAAPDAAHNPIAIRSASNADRNYDDWRALNDASEGILALQRRMTRSLRARPLISLIVPVYKVPVALVRALIDSLRAQTYPHWEACIALAWTGDPELTRYLRGEAAADPRVKLTILETNEGIAGNSNAALALAAGAFIGLLDHDDTLSPDALFEMARALDDDPDLDFLYSDKDMMDADGQRRMNPLFKPDWSPELMLSINYLTHFNVLRTSRVREIGGWDGSTDGAQDWDLFLRFIGPTTKVRAIKRPLYHWRIIETSVASGLAAKPWAAAAQLLAVTRYLQTSGWPGAVARFADENVIQVDWDRAFRPDILIVLFGLAPAKTGPGVAAAEACARTSGGQISFAYIDVQDQAFPAAVAAAVKRSRAQILVFLDARSEPGENWLLELVGPLQNRQIAAVGGRLEHPSGDLQEGGFVFAGGKAAPLFSGEPLRQHGVFASAWNCRNHLAVSGSCMALRREAWEAVGGFSQQPAYGRYDLDLGLKISAHACGRIMLNTYARTASAEQPIFAMKRVAGDRGTGYFDRHFPNGDPYFHPRLRIAGAGGVAFRTPTDMGVTDFAAEARYVAAHYDAPASVFARRPVAPMDAPIRRIGWFLPDFDMPFYGGILTILRAAEYLRTQRGLHTTFVVLGAKSADGVRAAIARAFPELADACDVVTIDTVEIAEDLVDIDAAVATLWVTAYAIIRLPKVRRRFYFVQDYEPLFYPAGTTYSLAEATYRMGFHAICNTYPLRRLYEQHGGAASHFLPAIDTKVFHREGRTRRAPGEPFLVFNYARPGHPRNCFEVVAEGLIALKKRMGDRVHIITAGADWNPAQYGLAGVVEHLGLLSYEETGRLYRSVDAGVVAMATPHPSYLPFELIACGALVLTNRNPHTTWLLKDEENCILFDLTRTAIADAVEKAFADDDARAQMTEAAYQLIMRDHSDWDATCARIASAVLEREI